MDKKEFEQMREKMKDIIEQVNLLGEQMDEVYTFLREAKPILENSTQITRLPLPSKKKF